MKHLKIVALSLIVFLGTGLCMAEPRTGILGAFSEEVVLLKSEIEDLEVESILGVDFMVGKLEGRDVVLAQSGIGKVNAAVTTALMIDHFHPSEIVFSGIAGSANPDLLPGDIVIAESTTQHDYGAILSGGFMHRPTKGPGRTRSNPLFFPAAPALLRMAQKASKQLEGLEGITLRGGTRKPRIVTGIVATGDVFIASSQKKEELRTRYKADAVEMEGAAVAQVCHQQDLPCLIIRSMSDSADENAVVDVRQFEKAAANNSAKLVIALIGLLGAD